MNEAIYYDIEHFPELFHRSGSMTPEIIPTTIGKVAVPKDLRAFWVKYGEVEAFESEEILVPSNDLNSVQAATASLAVTTADEAGFVFHLGYCRSLVLHDGSFVAIAMDGRRRLGRFSSLDRWYVATLRDEFGPRYGLGAMTHYQY